LTEARKIPQILPLSPQVLKEESLLTYQSQGGVLMPYEGFSKGVTFARG
jgi:hypothetical protein